MNTEIIVPEFTAEDYYTTSVPYEFLYRYKDDKFALGQMRERLKAQAASVGVKGFVGLWNAYLETMESQKGVILDNSTAFDGQEIELLSGRYLCDDYGVVYADKYGYEVNVCRHPIMPVQRLINIDSGEERIKIAFKKGKQWRNVIVEKSVIASGTAILQLAANGIMVNSENAKPLSTFLLEIEQMNYDAIPEQRSVSRLGWVGENVFSPYVDEVVFDGEINCRHIFNAVKPAGDYETWKNAMREVRAEKSYGRLFLAASFASAILEPCGLLPFFFHAWGGTEVGKTVGLMISASVWASPKMGEYITTFNSTAVGQEMTAAMLNSLPMCVDELQIQSSMGVKDFDRIIYQLTEGVGRTRGAKTGGLQRTATWRNCIITNGEHPICNTNSGGGAINRIIEFECDEKVYSDLVGICAIIAKNYGYAGRDFVQHIQSPGIMEKVNALQKKFYNDLLQYESTEKQAASASAILAADAVATELIFQDGNCLTIPDIAKIMTNKSEVDVNQRALNYIYDMVAQNENKFVANQYGDYVGEIWGRKDSECIYIIKSVFDKQMANEGFNSTAFLSWAKRRGTIVTGDNRRTVKMRVAGNAVNCVCLKANNYEPEKMIELKDYEDIPF